MGTIKTIQLSTEKARELYKTADATFRKLLEENFDKKDLAGKVTDRIKTFADVEKEIGAVMVPYSYPSSKEERSVNAFVRIQAISKALNEGWQPNFSDTNEQKWYPYFQKTGAGWVLCVSSYFIWSASMGCGFYFKSSELATYAGTQFLDIYKEYLPE